MATKRKEPVKVQLLSEENHPILGHIERWRCEDGRVWRFGPKGFEQE